ncbi:unnamed protein product [Leptidea sinapis]|uniref:Uncharacterized protein n=1 Tax=Leptidea sinapis TaxID=189913 RepID=A0A5E4Q2X9_9NEOP|nr:unnamed protein product [Leptidea sinapis]
MNAGAKLASKKLGVLKQYFSLQLYKAQIRPRMEYCSPLWLKSLALRRDEYH